MGSSVPYGAKPFPPEIATDPTGVSQKLTDSIASWRSVWGWRESMKPSPHPPKVSSPSSCVRPSKFGVTRSTNRLDGLSKFTIAAGWVR
jgi:hypothetical protein